MAMRAVLLVVFMAVAAVSVGGKNAPPPVDCTSVVLSLTDCLSYVTNGSTVVKPEGNCCSGLKSVLKTNAECLCEGFKSSSQFGVVLNVTKALALPDACHVHAPSVSKCGLSVSPTGAPSPVAGGGSSDSLSPAGAPSGSVIAGAPGSSQMPPALSPDKAGSSSAIAISVQLIVVGLGAAFFL